MNIAKLQLEKLGSGELQKLLIKVTIAGSGGKVKQTDKSLLLSEYAKRAFPKTEILEVEPTNTAASLNSLSGKIKIKKDKKTTDFFGKIHIEANTGKLNALGAEKEYLNADLLLKAGWPVLQPAEKSKNPDYPLLLYPIVKASPLFDKLEQSHIKGKSTILSKELKQLENFNRQIGEKEVKSLIIGKIKDAVNSPVQYLFLKRFEKNGRIDQWYKSNILFKLPGIKKAITWKELLNVKWEINGQEFDSTLRQIIEQSRESLAFKNEKKAFMSIYHGDDHAGNIRLTNPPVVFDPAFAGLNPAALDLKILAHNGFIPMAAMYYPPKGLRVEYKKSGKRMIVSINIQKLPLYKTHEVLAKQVIDLRIMPILKAIKAMGGNIDKEKGRIKSGLAGCSLLTINIASLLNQSDGRGIGLLPLSIMFFDLKGLPMLEYLNDQINGLEKLT